MYNKLSNLAFVIGIFFTIISLILIIGGLLSAALAYRLNFYTGFSLLVFGLFMIFFNGNNKSIDKEM